MIDAFLGGLESVFGWLLEASWQASVLVALVLLLQALLRGRLNPRWHHALWLLVIARLLLPFLPESALSLFQFAPSPPPVVTETVTEPIFHPSPAPMVGITSVPAPPVAYPLSVFTVLALIWLTGALALLVLTWQVNRRFARHVVAAPTVTDPRLLKLAEAAQQELGLHRRLRIIESALVQSPAIMGLFRPTLILPKEVRTRFADAELRFIFLHEFAHLKRGDLFLQWLVALLQILHWFNPVLWYAFRRMRADREPATDALVLSRAGEAQKEPYGQVLVKLLEHYHQRHSLPTLVGILEDKDQFKRRFVLITKFTRGAYGWSLLGMLLLGVLAVGGLTKSKAADSSGAVETPSASLARDAAAPSASSSDRGIVLTGYAGRPAQASPINGAIGANDYDTVKSLLDHGSNFDAVDVQEALRDGRRQIVALLWSHGPPYYCSELAYAVSQDQPIEKIVEILKKGSPVTPPEDTLITPLGLAAQRGNIPVVKLLLDHGADLHPADPKLNPLDAAAGVGKHPEMVDFLLQQGAQVTRWTLIQTIVWSLGSGRKPYEDSTHVMGRLIQAGALKGIPEDESALLLLLACQKQNPDILRQLLDAGLSPRSRFKASTGLGSTALEVIQKQMAPYPGDTQKQILDMLEAADKGASTNTNTSSPRITLVAQTTSAHDASITVGANTVTGSALTKALVVAAKAGDLAKVGLLLKQGADPNAEEDSDWMTPLVAAVGSDRIDVVKLLLQNGANPNQNDKRWMSITLLNAKSAAMIKVLLDAGANPNLEDEYGTPLAWAPDAESVRLLVQHGANLHPKLENGFTLIETVANYGDNAEVVEELIKQGADFDPKGQSGAMALGYAAGNNDVKIMKLLMDNGVSPNVYGAENYMEDSPLGMAAFRPNTEAVKLLLERGADPEGDPRASFTPLSGAIMFNETKNANLLRAAGAHDVGDLSAAVAAGDNAKVTALLHDGANVNEVDRAGNTPLLYAVRRGQVDMAKLLLAHGANINQFNSFGVTPTDSLDGEANSGNPDQTQLDWDVPKEEGQRRLAAFKALFLKYPPDPNYRDSRGRTALHQAAISGNVFLPIGDKAHPVNPNVQDHDGNTPLVLAVLSPHVTDLKMRVSVPEKSDPKKLTPWNSQAYIVYRLLKAGAKLDLKMANGQTVGELAMAAAVKAQNPQLISVLHDAGVAEPASPPQSPDQGAGTKTTDAATPTPDLPATAATSTTNSQPTPPERADKTSTSAQSAVDARFDELHNKLRIEIPQVQDMPLDQFIEKIRQLLAAQDPQKKGLDFVLNIPPGEPPIPVSLDFTKIPGYRANAGMVLDVLKRRYPIRYKEDVVPGTIYIWQLSHAEIEFHNKAQETKISLDFDHTEASVALTAIQSAAAAKGFTFNMEALDSLKALDAIPAHHAQPITLKDDSVSVEQALRSVFYLADLVPTPLKPFIGYQVTPGDRESLRQQTKLKFQVEAVSFQANDAPGISRFLADFHSEPILRAPYLMMPAYPWSYQGNKDIAPRGTIGIPLNLAKGKADLSFSFKPVVIDKTDVQVTGTIEIKAPDGSTLGKISGQWTEPSGDRVNLLSNGEPMVITSPDANKSKQVVFVLAQATLVDADENLLVPASNKVDEVELSQVSEKTDMDTNATDAAINTVTNPAITQTAALSDQQGEVIQPDAIHLSVVDAPTKSPVSSVEGKSE